MNNNEKYKNIFISIFQNIPDNLEELTYQSIPNWDSVGHMTLIAALEDAFDIMLDTDDILNLNSFNTGKEILKKYDVQF